jgi:hypothetical protein
MVALIRAGPKKTSASLGSAAMTLLLLAVPASFLMMKGAHGQTPLAAAQYYRKSLRVIFLKDQ